MLETYYIGTDGEKTVWVDALAKSSQGWPQHINRVGVAAGRVIRSHDGRLERHLLEQALAKGEERKNDYYTRRLAAGDRFPALYKKFALVASDRDGILSEETLRHLAASTLAPAQVSFDNFLSKTLHAGLLAPVAKLPYHYKFSIPSIRHYLCSLPVDFPDTE